MLIFWYIVKHCMPYRYVQSVIWKSMCGGTKFGVEKGLFSTKHHTNDNYQYVTSSRPYTKFQATFSIFSKGNSPVVFRNDGLIRSRPIMNPWGSGICLNRSAPSNGITDACTRVKKTSYMIASFLFGIFRKKCTCSFQVWRYHFSQTPKPRGAGTCLNRSALTSGLIDACTRIQKGNLPTTEFDCKVWFWYIPIGKPLDREAPRGPEEIFGPHLFILKLHLICLIFPGFLL